MNVSSTALVLAGLVLLGLTGNSEYRRASTEASFGPVTSVHASAPSVSMAEVDPAPALNDMVEEYCVRCHNERRLRGDLSLEGFDAALPEENAPIAERMIQAHPQQRAGYDLRAVIQNRRSTN